MTILLWWPCTTSRRRLSCLLSRVLLLHSRILIPSYSSLQPHLHFWLSCHFSSWTYFFPSIPFFSLYPALRISLQPTPFLSHTPTFILSLQFQYTCISHQSPQSLLQEFDAALDGNCEKIAMIGAPYEIEEISIMKNFSVCRCETASGDNLKLKRCLSHIGLLLFSIALLSETSITLNF